MRTKCCMNKESGNAFNAIILGFTAIILGFNSLNSQ